MEFHVITCDLTATAPHLLASAVPWIRITVSKSPFFNKSWKVYVLSYHLIQRNRPPPPTIPSLHKHTHPPPPFLISHLYVLYHVLLVYDRIFLVYPAIVSFSFHKEVVVLAAMQQIQFVRRLLHILCRDNAELFYRTTRLIALIFLLCFCEQK